MSEKMTALLEKISKDEDLQAKLQAAGSPEKAFDLIKDMADGVTFDEFVAAAKQLKEGADLSEADLNAVAGGVKLGANVKTFTLM